MRLRRSLQACVAVVAAAAGAFAWPAHAQGLEYAVKAAFLTKFAAFVSWPPGTGAGPVRVCIVGDDPFGPAVENAAAGQVVVRRLAAVDRGSGCQVLYAAGSSRQSVAQALQAVRGAPVLTVTDAARGGPRGMIHFVVFQDRVRFHVDAAQAAQGGLSISSKLLALGLSVKR
ncbi:YfiR family protein [Phenylobacterium sp.]|uniref:YfiR family protein n=1 Tax=Phenylobacterium sp. TaxID=1871053 RepID=UPI002B5C4996|nr:YfiR family protein [Phenylobacterium sp.]HVI33352.1 YfiR family protein [Phenylobacterium sp.]